MRLSILALLLLRHLVIVAGVVSPLDKVTQDMKVMKETLDSIQASLITSVSLLQGESYVILGSALSSSLHCCELAMLSRLLQ